MGCEPDKPTLFNIGPTIVGSILVPRGYQPKNKRPDLSAYVGEIWNQGSTQACTGYAMVKGAELLIRKAGYVPPKMSASFPWQNALFLQNGEYSNSGVRTSMTQKAVNKYGICQEHLSPSYSMGRSNQLSWAKKRPPFLAYTSGRKWKRQYDVKSSVIFVTGDRAVDHMLYHLDRETPLCMPIPIDDEFVDGKGVIGTGGEILGWHLVLVVDYRVNESGGYEFLIVNSWGENWAESGMAWCSTDLVKESAGLYTLSCEVTI